MREILGRLASNEKKRGKEKRRCVRRRRRRICLLGDIWGSLA